MSKKKEFSDLDLLTAYEIKGSSNASLKVKDILPNKNQPRLFNKNKVDDLVESITRLGLIEPIVVRKVGLRYEIVAGERRFNAVKKLGWDELPAIITDADEEKCYEMALAENEKRKNLNPWEVGKAIQYLRTEKKRTADEVSKILGFSERYVKQLSSIARLEFKKVHELIESGQEPSVRNLETALKKKEGRGGEIVSPQKIQFKTKINYTSLQKQERTSFLKELKILLKKYNIDFES